MTILPQTIFQALQRLGDLKKQPTKQSEIQAYDLGYASGLDFASTDSVIPPDLVEIDEQPWFAQGVLDRRDGKPKRATWADETKKAPKEPSIIPAVVGGFVGLLGLFVVLKAARKQRK